MINLKPEELKFTGKDGVTISVVIPKAINELIEQKARDPETRKSTIIRKLLMKGLVA
jgi:hypothetical protein